MALAPKRSYLDVIGPRFFVEINGKPIDDLLPHIVSFQYIDNEKKADELSIHFSNKSLRWQDDPRFLKGVKLKVRWGYPNDVSNVRSMVSVGVELSMSTDIPGIVLKAYDKRHEMSKKTSTKGQARSWGFKSSTDIARSIAKDHGLKFQGEDSKDSRKEYRSQTANQSDVQLLTGLAEKLHWDFYVEGDTLHFHKKRLKTKGAGAVSFAYQYFTDGTGDLIEFSTDLNLRKKAKTGETGVDPKTGKVHEASADATTTEDQKTGDHAVVLLSRGLIYEEAPYMGPTPETTLNTITIQAKAKHGKGELDGLEAKITVIGTPKMGARSMVHLSGVGKTYSGDWRVTEARHVINPTGSVYVTSCEMKRNALSKGDKKGKVSSPAVTKEDKGGERVTVFMDTGGISSFSME